MTPPVAWATPPLSELEHIVLQVEKHLNSTEIKIQHPEIGEDIKVMGVRKADNFDLTIACAFIDRYIKDVNDYVNKKAHLISLVEQTVKSFSNKQVSVTINAADDIASGSLYLTVTGTSAESGDDGQVGRGNRVNGLISPYRPMNMEAAAGKNPVTHVANSIILLHIVLPSPWLKNSGKCSWPTVTSSAASAAPSMNHRSSICNLTCKMVFSRIS